jgi:hypothetical protein
VLAVTTPNESAQWGLRTRQRISWTFDGAASTFRIEVSRDAGATWEWLAEVPNKAGRSQNFYWDVDGAATEDGRVRVTALGPEEVSDTNDAAIAIGDAAIAVTVGTRRPVAFGAKETIAVRHNLGARKRVVIEVSQDGGTAWRTLVVTTTRGATTSTHKWTVDLLPTGRAVVRVRALDGSDATGVSPTFPVVAPAATKSR